MCFVHIRAMAAGAVSGGVLLALGILGTQGVANAAPTTRAASPATKSNCVPVAASSPGTPTQTPTTPAPPTTPASSSPASNAASSDAPAQSPATSKTSATPDSSSAKPSSAQASTATLSAFLAAPAASSSPSPSPAPTPELCISVTQPASSIQRGQTGTFTVQVSSKNWTPPDTVTVELQASVTPAFTTQDGAVCKPAAKSPPVECTMPVPTGQPVSLQAQVPVAASATSVSQVTLTATALPATAKLTGPLSVSETAQVTAAPTTKHSSSAAASTPPARHVHSTAPLGPVGSGSFGLAQAPDLNVPDLSGVGSSVLGVGNAANLFPRIGPSASPSPPAGANGANGRKQPNADPPTKVSLLPLGMPVMTAQVIGLLALGLAFLLALTRLSLRRSVKKPRSQA